MTEGRIKIGTRGSPLALAQAHDVRARLVRQSGIAEDLIDIVVIETTGDRILDRSLMAAGGKGLFTKEIEEALYDQRIDLAVHSGKDVPTVRPPGFMIAAHLPREDPRDVFISPHANSLSALEKGMRLGTASLRRRALALRARPDLDVVTFRGNVQTRLKKLEDGVAHATFLARAGLNRLGRADVATDTMDLAAFPPAPAQGIVMVECRTDDHRVRDVLAPLHDSDAATAAAAERAFLAALDGSCRTPIAAHASLEGDRINLRGLILSVDGRDVYEDTLQGDRLDAASLGTTAGHNVKKAAGSKFFETLQDDISAFAQ